MDNESTSASKIQATYENFVAWMKIAVAVAMIRAAPPNMKGREFAEKLAFLYQHQQQQWKSKYEKAAEENLYLRQQMVLRNVQELASTSSSCTDFGESQALFPTPPSSGQPERSSSTDVLFCDELYRNTKFLQVVIKIKKTAGQSHQHSLLYSIASKTLHRSVKVIRKMLVDDQPFISITNMKLSVQSIVTLVEDDKFSQDTQLNIQICGIVKDLIEKIMSTDGLDKEPLHVKKNLEELLVCFAVTKSCILLTNVFELLLTEIEKFCGSVRKSCIEGELVDLEQYENVYHIISALLRCVQDSKTVLTTNFGKNICDGIEERLDDALLYISDKYPLLAHSLWRIGAVLQAFKLEAS